MKRHHWITVGAPVAVMGVGGLALLLHGVGSSSGREALLPSAQAQTPAPTLPVQTTTPARRDVSRLIALPGDVKPWQETTLYSRVAGYLETIAVDKGDRVKTGEVLATLRAPDLAAEREQAQQSYASRIAAAQGSQADAQQAVLAQDQAHLAADKAAADFSQAGAAIQKAQAQADQAAGALRQAEAQKAQAEAARDESTAQAAKAQADLEAAQAEQHLAEETFARYKGIYDTDHALIAKQDVDTQESKASAARSRAAAAQSQVEAAQRHAKAAEAQVNVADSQIAQARSLLTASREQVTIARAQQVSLQKQRDLAQEQIRISGMQRTAAAARAQQARHDAEAGRSALGRATAFADFTRIRAPFDGVVVQRMVDPGAFIQAAATNQSAAPLVTVAQVSQVRVYVNVPEAEARYVRPGTPVLLALTGQKPTDPPLKATISRTSESLDPKTRTLLAEADLPNPQRQLLPGAYVSVKVVQETHQGVLSVPTAAIQVEKTGKFVFVVEGGKAKRLPVTVGFNDGKFTEIQEGLGGKEEVVVTGRDALAPGTPVTATTWTGTAPVTAR